ncbi:hypothetical protein EVAR_14799_1 [Eumeta japonica]|uniref:Uncharacterized protein n=1 Tax=Eumeta variegata TaxID=151549 RepID=A0A4C1TXR1_EUMVA|nr:hypothetical protein EVAR_14799_1 [Eumeta japonica]
MAFCGHYVKEKMSIFLQPHHLEFDTRFRSVHTQEYADKHIYQGVESVKTTNRCALDHLVMVHGHLEVDPQGSTGDSTGVYVGRHKKLGFKIESGGA